MPFVRTNAPAAFMDLINRVCRPMLDRTVIDVNIQCASFIFLSPNLSHLNHTLQAVNPIEYSITLISKGVEYKGNGSELT